MLVIDLLKTLENKYILLKNSPPLPPRIMPRAGGMWVLLWRPGVGGPHGHLFSARTEA